MNKEEYLVKKGRKADPKLGKLYVINSTRAGVELVIREVWEIVKGPSIQREGDKDWTSSKRYILKESPYEIDIYNDETSGESHGYGSGTGDLWHWSHFAFLDGKEAAKKLHEEKERVAIAYLGKEAPKKKISGTIVSKHIATDDQLTVFGKEIKEYIKTIK